MTVAPPEIPALAGISNASPKPSATTGLLTETGLFPGLLDAIELDLAKEDAPPRDLPLNAPSAHRLEIPEPEPVSDTNLAPPEDGETLPHTGNLVPNQHLDIRPPIERDMPRELGFAEYNEPPGISAIDKPLPAQGDIEVGQVDVKLRRDLNPATDQPVAAKLARTVAQIAPTLADPALVDSRPDAPVSIRRSAPAEFTPDAIAPAHSPRKAAQAAADEKDTKAPDRREDARAERPAIDVHAGRAVLESPAERGSVEAREVPERADVQPRSGAQVTKQSVDENFDQERQHALLRPAAMPEVAAPRDTAELRPTSGKRIAPDEPRQPAVRDELGIVARDQGVNRKNAAIGTAHGETLPKEARQKRTEIADSKPALAPARTLLRAAKDTDQTSELDKRPLQPIRHEVTASAPTAAPSQSVLAGATSAPVQSAELPATQQPAAAQPSAPTNPVSAPVEARSDARATTQLDSVIDHLVEARESGRAAKPEMTLRHQEFGAINLRLEATGADLRASLSARDPAFVPAVQAALADRAIAASSESAPGQSQRGQDQQGANQNWSGGHGSSQSDRSYGSSTGSGHASSQPYPEQTSQRDEEAGGRSSALTADRDSRDEHNSGLFA